MAQLGPAWSQESSARFYNAFCKLGKDWAVVAARVPGRSPMMVKAMYRSCRRYLSLPEPHRCCAGFQANVKDLFAQRNANASESSSDDSSFPTPSRVAASPRGRRGNSFSKPSSKRSRSKHPSESPRTLSEDEATSARGRGKRKRGDALTRNSPHPQHVEPPGKRKRKSHTTAGRQEAGRQGLETLLAVMAGDSSEGGNKLKLKTKFKGKPPVQHVPTQTEQWLGALNLPTAATPTDAAAIPAADAAEEPIETTRNSLLAAVHHRLASRKVRRWSWCEWFYSGIEQLYWRQNEFKMLLNEIGIGHMTELTRTEWSHIRGQLGKPRRLSAVYLHQERQKLQQYGSTVRAKHAGRKVTLESTEGIEGLLEQIPAPLKAGQRVLARHPENGELYLGNILLKSDQIYRVQFDNPSLGVLKIPDNAVMPHPPGLALPLFVQPLQQLEMDPNNLPPNAAVLALQLQSMLSMLGVHVAVHLPPPFCAVPHWLPAQYHPHVVSAARALRDHMLQPSAAVGGELALEAALNQLSAIPGAAMLCLSPELMVQQSLAAASRTVQAKLAAASTGKPEEQRLAALVARCVATLLVVHDAATASVAEQTDALRQLTETLKPLGPSSDVDFQELRHSMASLAEATRMLQEK